VLGYLSFHYFDAGQTVWGVVTAVGAALGLHMVGRGLIGWRGGVLPEFRSSADVRRSLGRSRRPS
jgi:hypothetical protein